MPLVRNHPVALKIEGLATEIIAAKNRRGILAYFE